MLEEENRRLRRGNAILREERQFVKTVLVFFTRESPSRTPVLVATRASILCDSCVGCLRSYRPGFMCGARERSIVRVQARMARVGSIRTCSTRGSAWGSNGSHASCASTAWSLVRRSAPGCTLLTRRTPIRSRRTCSIGSLQSPQWIRCGSAISRTCHVCAHARRLALSRSGDRSCLTPRRGLGDAR
jgi:hypothetical protein